MAERSTFSDIAALAGVGIATVDRVLNERGHVSQATALRVVQAARALNLRRVLPALTHRLLRIEVLLARPELPLIGRISREFGRQAARIDKSVIIERTLLRSDDPRIFAQAIRASRADAIIAYTQAHPLIHQAIAAAAVRGAAFITMFSDLPDSQRYAYVGTDHYAAGRTAGLFMARFLRRVGPILVLCHHFGFVAHQQRVMGFRDAMARYGHGEAISEIIEGNDDAELSESLLRHAFRMRGDVVGLYNVGAANDACGLALKAGLLRELPVFIGHELTAESRPLLRDGTMALVIDQDPEHQASLALDIILRRFGTEPCEPRRPYTANLAFRLFTAENFEDAPSD